MFVVIYCIFAYIRNIFEYMFVQMIQTALEFSSQMDFQKANGFIVYVCTNLRFCMAFNPLTGQIEIANFLLYEFWF